VYIAYSGKLETTLTFSLQGNIFPLATQMASPAEKYFLFANPAGGGREGVGVRG
jgi:hypothetical protein